VNPFPIVLATLRGHRLTCGLFVLLVALAVALGVAVTAQERALRKGSARAADAFDLIVAAPGSQTDVLLAAVYLRPTAMELVPGDALARLYAEPRATLVAPLAFGDSVRGNVIVGTTAAFVDHLSGGLAEGRSFAAATEAVVGALAPIALGEQLKPIHGMHEAESDEDHADAGHEHEGEHDAHGAEDGHREDGHGVGEAHEAAAGAGSPPVAPPAAGDAAAEGHAHEDGDHDGEAAGVPADHHDGEAEDHDHDAHGAEVAEGHQHGLAFTVVGRMKPTGTPWDRAVVVPVEYVWAVHGLASGHAAGETRIGPPFAAERLPGVPAVVVSPDSVAAAYGLRNAYRDTRTTAFFPAEALGELYAILGDVARLLGLLTLATQSLVVAAIAVGVLTLLELYRRRFALLRALGASRAFVFVTVWSFVAGLVAVGAILGLGLGYGVAILVSAVLAGSTGIAMPAGIGASEFLLAGGIVAVGALLALIPAAISYRRPPVAALRQS